MVIKTQKQLVMRKVIYSLFPAILGAVFFFGWYSLIVILTSLITCYITEWLFVRKKNGAVSEAALVTAILFALTLPPTIPLFMVVLGASFGIIFGKMAFGGFGGNIFNPALVGRAFIYIAFPIHMTNRWIPASDWKDFPGGLISWQVFTDSITRATPLSAFREGADINSFLLKLIMGNISGSFENLGETMKIGGGSIGETSALLIACGGVYLLIKKIANWKVIVSFFSFFLLFSLIFHSFYPEKTASPLIGIFSGGIIFGGFYMITDPVSMSKTNIGQWIYGAVVAFITLLIRSFSLFAGGMMFAILLGNMFNPIIDFLVTEIKKGGKK